MVNDKSNGQLLKFTLGGNRVLQIGKRGSGHDCNATSQRGSPADVAVDVAARAAYAVDGLASYSRPSWVAPPTSHATAHPATIHASKKQIASPIVAPSFHLAHLQRAARARYPYFRQAVANP